MAVLFFVLMIGLELKHFVADYLLQPGWILAGKGDFRKPGGYAHAGIHVAFSALVLALAGTPLAPLLAIIAAEFVIHYLLDYAKIHYSHSVRMDSQAPKYWALFGLDQTAHQLTYAAMIWAALWAQGLI